MPFLALAQSGQTPSSSTVPAKVKKGAKAAESTPDIRVLPKPDEPKHDYSQEAFVVELYRSSFRFESDGTGRRAVFHDPSRYQRPEPGSQLMS